MLPERSDKQQQQHLSQKVSAGRIVRAREIRSLREQRISGVLAPFRSIVGLPQPFGLCSEQPRCLLSAAANSFSSSSATKRVRGQGANSQSTRVRCRRRRRKAPSMQPSSNPPLPAVLHPRHASLGRAQRRRSATGAAVWPRQGQAPSHRGAAGRPTPRCGGSSRTSPTLAPHLPAPVYHPVGTQSCPPSRRTGRS